MWICLRDTWHNWGEHVVFEMNVKNVMQATVMIPCSQQKIIGITITCLVFQVQRGNLKKAIELFDKAIPLANTELEMVRIETSLIEPTTAQHDITCCHWHLFEILPSWFKLVLKWIIFRRVISLVWGMQPWLKSQSLPSWASLCPPWAWWARLAKWTLNFKSLKSSDHHWC